MELNTFSIVGRCPRTGQLGVAVSSAVPAVGSMCPYTEAGVGAVSTQSWVNPALAIEVLAALRRGLGAEAALRDAIAADPGRELRQIGVVDAAGQAASHTGALCTDWHGQIVGEGFAVQGNMLAGAQVLDAMASAFMAAASEPLDERLMQALEAGQRAGGDKRGKQSAALLVHDSEDDAMLDLRVDDHADPLGELARLEAISRERFIHYRRFTPSRQSPAGLTDREALEAAIKRSIEEGYT